MRPDRPSRTAEGIAGARARESAKPEADRLFYDPYARHFMSRRFRIMASIPLVLRLFRWRNSRVLPGMFGGLVVRTRYIDDLLLRFLEEGIQQVVILGAGYDTRAYRMAEMGRGGRIFEVDHPSTQRLKVETMRTILGRLPDHVTFVPVQFQSEDLAEKLEEKGYSRKTRTFFIWEGVTMYLEADRVDATLAFIAGQSARGSAVVFDYFPPSVAHGTCPFREARTLTRMVRGFGEEILFGLEPETIVDYLDRRGLRVIQRVTAEECRRWYFKSDDHPLKVSRMFHFVYAEVRG